MDLRLDIRVTWPTGEADLWGWQSGTVRALQIEVCGRESFGNSRGLVSIKVFLPFCVNIIQKIYIGTSVSSSTMLLFCPISLGFKGWLYLLCIIQLFHLGLLFQWPHHFHWPCQGFQVQNMSPCIWVSVVSPVR